MFGLGMPEVLLILAIALIVIGPKKLPDLAKTLGRAMGEFKRSAQDFKRSIDIDTTISDIEPPKAPDLKQVLKEANTESSSAREDESNPPHKDSSPGIDGAAPENLNDERPEPAKDK